MKNWPDDEEAGRVREEKKKKKKSQKRTDCEKERRRITREVGEGDDKSKKKNLLGWSANHVGGHCISKKVPCIEGPQF